MFYIQLLCSLGIGWPKVDEVLIQMIQSVGQLGEGLCKPEPVTTGASATQPQGLAYIRCFLTFSHPSFPVPIIHRVPCLSTKTLEARPPPLNPTTTTLP